MFKEEKCFLADDEHTQSRSLGEEGASSVKGRWREYKLCQVCTLINGRAYSKTELLDEGKYPVLRVGNFFTNNHWYYSDMELAPDKYCDDGDLLYAWSASFGPRIWAGRKVIFHYHIWKVLPNAKLIDKRFLFFWFLWDADHIRADQGTGTTMMHVAKGSMDNREILLPSLSEQERIVAILDEAFEGIAAARTNVEMSLTKANDLLDVELQLLLPPCQEGWKQLTLAEVASDYGRGKSKHRPRNDPKLYGGAYPFVQTGDVRNAKQYVTTYSQTYNDLGLSQSKLWPKGTLCVTIAANIAETAILDFDACFPDSVIGIVANPSKANTRFIEYQLRVAKAQLQAKGKGSAQDNINLGTFETHTFSFPPLAVQEVLVERLDSIASLSASLTDVLLQKFILLDELKQSLLNQAFSGSL